MFLRFRGIEPQVAPDVFIAPGAWLIGQVTVGSGSSIWFNSILRGDVDSITIGEESNIQDNCVLHPDAQLPLLVGNQVTVAHGCILHGCRIGNRALIGMGTVILSGAVIGDGTVIAARSLVTGKMVAPPGTLVSGSPAKVVRQLNTEEQAQYQGIYLVYRERANLYQRETPYY